MHFDHSPPPITFEIHFFPVPKKMQFKAFSPILCNCLRVSFPLNLHFYPPPHTIVFCIIYHWHIIYSDTAKIDMNDISLLTDKDDGPKRLFIIIFF